MNPNKTFGLLFLISLIGSGSAPAKQAAAQSLDINPTVKQSYTGGILLTRDQCKQVAKLRKVTQLKGQITLSAKEIKALGLKSSAENHAEGCNGGLMD